MGGSATGGSNPVDFASGGSNPVSDFASGVGDSVKNNAIDLVTNMFKNAILGPIAAASVTILGMTSSFINDPSRVVRNIADPFNGYQFSYNVLTGDYYSAGNLYGDNLTDAAIILAMSCLCRGSRNNGSGSGDYNPPNGGGGPTSTTTVRGKKITFGHGGRHLEGTGLSTQSVNQAIANDVASRQLTSGVSNSFSITIGGHTLEYRAFLRPDGTINVGTYFILR